MKLRLAALAIIIVLVAAAASAIALTKMRQGDVEFRDARAVYTGAVIGVFGVLENPTGEKVCIVGVKLAEHVEGRVKAELHQTVRQGDVYKMLPVKEVCAEPGGRVELRHGGYHIMIMGDRRALDSIVSDGKVELVLELSGGREIRIVAPLK